MIIRSKYFLALSHFASESMTMLYQPCNIWHFLLMLFDKTEGIDFALATRMRSWPTISLAIFLGVFAMVIPAKADKLHFANGDVVSGALIRMEANRLMFQSTYAGEINVDWSEVVNLVTDGPITVNLDDGQRVQGIARGTSAKTMRLETEKDGPPSVFSMLAVAAINPDKKPSVSLSARINAGLTQQRGNTDTDTYRLDGEFKARYNQNRYMLVGELNKENAKNKTTVQNWLAFGRYKYFPTLKWFLYTQGLFEYDKFADLDLRSTIGAGPGYQFFESEDLNLSVSAGFAWVDENFDEAEDNDFAAGQWLIDYDQYLFSRRAQLFHRQLGWVSVSDSEDWTFKSRQGVRFPIYKGFTTTLQYNYDYDNNASEDSEEKWDSKLMMLFGWQFTN